MGKFLGFLFIVGVGLYFYQQQRQGSQNPESITNPVYAEMHMSLQARGRTFKQVLFVKTVDDADCKKQTTRILGDLEKSSAGDPNGGWTVESSDCKAELAARHAKLFDDEATNVTYLKLARGDRKEREGRLIYWGVSPEESDRVCDGVAAMQKGRKGAVTCIRSIR